MKTNDGGPAFPCDWKDFQPETGNQVVREQFPGMSLRDWFAGMALQGCLARQPTTFDPISVKHDLEEAGKVLARWAYQYADDMLAERSRTP